MIAEFDHVGLHYGIDKDGVVWFYHMFSEGQWEKSISYEPIHLMKKRKYLTVGQAYFMRLVEQHMPKVLHPVDVF